MDSSKFLYCRSCQMKTHHRKILRYDWGYSCDICGTWQHQSQLAQILQSYAAKAILEGLNDDEIRWHDSTLEEFIEAAQALDLEYDYQKTDDGYDFKAWHPDSEEKVAKIIL